jgi:cerevisin
MKAVALALLPLAAASPLFEIGTIHKDAAPIVSSSNAKDIPNSYMIKFKKHVKHEDAQAHHSWVQEIHLNNENERTELRKRGQFPIVTEAFEGIKHTYNIAGDFLGYSGHFDESVIDEIRRHPDVRLSLLSPRRAKHPRDARILPKTLRVPPPADEY